MTRTESVSQGVMRVLKKLVEIIPVAKPNLKYPVRWCICRIIIRTEGICKGNEDAGSASGRFSGRACKSIITRTENIFVTARTATLKCVQA